MAENTIDIAGASQDLQTIEDFVNLPADSEVYPRLLPSVNVGTLAGARQAIFEAGGLPATPFATKVLMTASALVDGKYAQVTEDSVAANNGLYVKTAGAWIKSGYDPVAQMIDKVSNNPLYKPQTIRDLTDANTLKVSGIYVITSTKAVKITHNYPADDVVGVLVVYSDDVNLHVFQSFTTSNNVTYSRYLLEDTWTAWVNLSLENKANIELNKQETLKANNFIDANFKTSTNLFRVAELNKTMDVDGSIIYDAVRWISDYIPVSAGEVYTAPTSSYRIGYYDKDKVFISRGGTTSQVTVAEGVSFIRFSAAVALSRMQINKGAVLLPYETAYTTFKNPKPKDKVTVVDTDFFDTNVNLFDVSAVLLNTSVSTTGDIEVEEGRWLSDYIPVQPSETINIGDNNFRVAYYTKDKEFISRGGAALNGESSYVISSSADVAYMRLSSTRELEGMQVTRGAEQLPFKEFGKVQLKDEYLAKNTASDIDLAALKAEILAEIPTSNYEPSFPTLNFTEVETTWRQPTWLSKNGEVIWGSYGKFLLQSTDDWVTRVQVGGELPIPSTVSAIRELDNGELLLASTRDDTAGIVAKVFKTVGYDVANPSAATFKEVLAIGSTEANITNIWGMSVYQNIVTVSEYGLRGENGAKNVYLSTDYGETFELIFNQYTAIVDGRPPLTDTAHVHTAAYDPYYNRIWVVVGDKPNTATYFSDDMGVSWTYVTGSNVMQYTGILALPDAVIFGSDRAPNGVYVYKRKGKDKMPVIEELLIINNDPLISHVFALPFKRDWQPTTPVYFSGGIAGGTNNTPVIVTTVDGKKAQVMWTGEPKDRLALVVGPTASGKVIAVKQTETSGGLIIMVADAPNFIKV